MSFGFIGISYKNAPLEIRDRIFFTDCMKMEFLDKMQEAGMEQCMVLSTCNRSEVYFFYQEESQFELAQVYYRHIFSDVDVEVYCIKKRGKNAFLHLFRVTAGLESMVLGEDQILGQVGDAIDFSRTMGHSGKELNRVVQEAVSCAKRIKTELKISENPLSVGYIGICQLNEICGIQGKKILVIGSGKTASLVLTYLYEYGAGKVYACNRTLAHAKKLREKFSGLQVVEYANRYEVMSKCDIIISATASPHLVIRREEVICRQDMVFVDLAAPRDIDAELAKEPHIRLINLDTHQQIARKNQKERERLVSASRNRIEEGVEEVIEWLHASRMDSTIESLQHRCGEIAEDSFCYLNRKLDLSQREQKIMRKVLNASLQRLLKDPIRELKSLDTKEEQDEYKEIIRHLFQI